MSRNLSRARAGFTLVEVLLTLLIMGGIMVAITQILSAARTSRDTIHNIQETQLAGPAILDMIERDVRSLCTYGRTRAAHLRVKNRVTVGLDGDSLDFVGSTKSRVLAEVRERWVRSTISEVGYRLRINPEDDQFLEIWRREQYGVDEDPFEGGEYQFLHDRVKSFDVQVFEEDGPDAEPVEDWGTESAEERIGLPARVEITLTLELAPRLVNEQVSFLPTDRRTLTYKRMIRIPETLRVEERELAVPFVPEVPAANQPAGTTQTGGSAAGRQTTTGGGDGVRTETRIQDVSVGGGQGLPR